MLVFQSRVLSRVNHVSKVLQYDDARLDQACTLIKNILNHFKEMRIDFDTLKYEAEKLANSWNIEPKIKEKR